MSRRFFSKGLRSFALIGRQNLYNNANRPFTEFGSLTADQILEKTNFPLKNICAMLGSTQKCVPLIKAIIRRHPKPFVLVEAESCQDSPLMMLPTSWTMDTPSASLPHGSGKVSVGNSIDCTTYLPSWGKTHLVIVHFEGELLLDVNLLNTLKSLNHAIIVCDALPQKILREGTNELTPAKVMKELSGFFSFSIGNSVTDLIEILPTYEYESATNQMGYSNGSASHPTHILPHRNRGWVLTQARTLEHKKALFEQDDIRKLERRGGLLICVNQPFQVYTAYLT